MDGVPMTMQWPDERDMQDSASQSSSSDIRPARRSAQSRQASVPEPSSSVRHLPRSMGPPVTMMAGTSAEAAPMSMAGVGLSQPQRGTTPAGGEARRPPSPATPLRIRDNNAPGFVKNSPREMGREH